MTDQPEMEQLDEVGLNAVLAKIGEILEAASSGGFIFRGEDQVFEHVSSGLFRKYHPNRTDTSDIEIFQVRILEEAKRFTTETDERELLSQLQHFGSGLTNLIDFTTDYLIALFFACEGAPELDGRIILLQKGNAKLFEPAEPSNRVIAQKSVFVRPPTGLVEPDDQVVIPSYMKSSVLQYLRTFHGITPHTIYNDLHGFIRHWSINQQASNLFMAGIEEALRGKHESAIACFSESLYLLPSYPVHYERGCSFLAICDFEKAIQDFDRVEWAALDDGYAGLSGAACNGRGSARRGQGNHKQAIKDFKSALTFYSMLPEEVAGSLEEEAFSNLVVALMEAGDYDSALSYGRQARERGYKPDAGFRADYGSVKAFESLRGTKVPDHLSCLL